VYAVDIPERRLENVKENLMDQAIDYSKEYLDRFNLFFHVPNRKSHFPYIL
jgi:uncharacterized protein YbcC (UPF0753/DUF2309 family)